MASPVPVPVKSEQLHNFSLPHLKWKNHRSGRSRLAGETSSSSPANGSSSTPWRQSPPPASHAHAPFRQASSAYVSRRPSGQSPLHKQSQMRDSESESELNSAVLIGKPRRIITSENTTKSIDGSKGNRSIKTCFRPPKNGNIDENHSSSPLDDAVPSSAAEEEESLPKTWNLRPRRTLKNHRQFNIGSPKIGSSQLPENKAFHGSNQSREASGVKNGEYINPMTLKNHKFSISLSREEIEEDIFSLTGSKPSRRPKKRPRTVQRQLDTLFPGLWLDSITADSYKLQST